MDELPFSGLRVLDAAGVEAPACGMLLNMLGAEVALLETAEDQARRDDLTWLSYNAGKQSVVVDWGSLSDVAGVERMMQSADVIIDSGLVLGGLHPLQANPSIIQASVTPFGLHGPRASWRGSELIAEASGGLLYGSGDPAYPPAISAIPVGACMAGAQAAVAILLATYRRQQTGRGERIDISQQEATASLMVGSIGTAFVNKTRPSRAPVTLTAGASETRYYESKDGGLFSWSLTTGPGFGALNAPAIAWLKEEGGGHSLAGIDFEKVSSHNMDLKKRAEWLEEFRDFFKRYTQAELSKEAVRRRIMLHPLNTIEDVVNDAVLRERQVFSLLEVPDGRKVPTVSEPFKTTAPYRVHAGDTVPELGSANALLLQSWSGPSPWAAPQSGTDPSAPKPLSGLRVLDFSWIVAGPVTGKWLALAGADVLKIESRRRPDPNRMTGPFPLGKPFMDGGVQFPNNNANKRSVAINIAHPLAKDVILMLAEKADVVLENFSAGVMERLGYGYEALKERNPGIIMLSMSLQGQTGSRANQPGIGSHVQMRSGLDALTGFPGSLPGGPSVFLPDLLGPWVGIAGILGALEHRKRTGIGQYIDLSQYESMLVWMRPALLEYGVTETEPPRRGNASRYACPRGTYPVTGDDRWLAIECRDDGEWQSLWGLLPPRVQSRFASGLSFRDRTACSDELDAALADWLATRSGEESAVKLQGAGVPAYVVNDPLDLITDPQMSARKHCLFLEHSIIGTVPVELPAFRSSSWSFDPVHLGPLYASGTAEALAEWIDLDADTVADLIAKSVITFE